MSKDTTPLTVDELTDDQIERVLNSRGFQRMLAYQRLAEGISVLEEQDDIYESMVTSITNQHSSLSTESSTREVLELFVDEVAMFTEPLSRDGESHADADDIEDIFAEEP